MADITNSVIRTATEIGVILFVLRWLLTEVGGFLVWLRSWRRKTWPGTRPGSPLLRKQTPEAVTVNKDA